MKTILLKLKGMHCKSCVMIITDALKEVDGVKDAHVDLEKETAKVSYDEKTVKIEKMIDAVRKDGYDARI